ERQATGLNHARIFYRKDTLPEIEFALANNVPCFLVCFNSRRWELEPEKCRGVEVQIDPQAFEKFTTPPILVEDATLVQSARVHAESKTVEIFKDVSSLVQEGKLGENYSKIEPNDPRLKIIMDNFKELIDLLEKTEGTPEHAQVQEKIKALMNSRIPKKLQPQTDPSDYRFEPPSEEST
ncbi:MAG: hypothetical protein ACRDF4_06135, partial [Rhabdochlamydiaceae bacterium]